MAVPQLAGGLEPAEILLDPAPALLTQGESEMACRAAIEGTRPVVVRVLGHVRCDARAPATLHAVEGSTIGAITALIPCSRPKVILAEGAKGPIQAEIACLLVYPVLGDLSSVSPASLILRHTNDSQLKYALSNPWSDPLLSELCRGATLRWPIEPCFQDGKSQIDTGHYDHRSWPAGHRHMLYVFLALHFLLRLRIRVRKPPTLTLAQARTLITKICWNSRFPNESRFQFGT